MTISEFKRSFIDGRPGFPARVPQRSRNARVLQGSRKGPAMQGSRKGPVMQGSCKGRAGVLQGSREGRVKVPQYKHFNECYIWELSHEQIATCHE